MPILKDIRIYTRTSSDLARNERRDCGVRALMVVAQSTYAEAHLALEIAGRKPQFGTYTHMAEAAVGLVLPGARFEEIHVYALCSSPGRATMGAPTLAQFIKRHPVGRFYLCTTSHAFALVDGVVHDWVSTTSARSRVREAHRLVTK